VRLHGRRHHRRQGRNHSDQHEAQVEVRAETGDEVRGATEWTGTIVSRASGSTYYATMALKQSNTLRVEACAVGRFFCSGNDWSRIATNPQALITSRQATAQPPS
jgi:Na+-transporting NADH:ubiquinone oxidoreductase subunit NqrF